MAVSTQQYANLSLSSRRALGYALAATYNRNADPASALIEPEDLLVGVLLAHPDEQGEGRVFLGHFGLTARDVLPDTYPRLTDADLQRHVAAVSLETPPDLSPPAESALQAASLLSGSHRTELRHLLGALLESDSPLRRGFEQALSASGASATAVLTSYRQWLEEGLPPDVVAGQALSDMLVKNHRRRPIDVPSYSADRPDAAVDLIGIREEVDAFAYLLASKALRPPLAVGLFGEWGSGKSFFMESVENRVGAISRQVTDGSAGEAPFWKQIRQIRFNAWQYVETTLWASLLNHIFEQLKGQRIGLVEERRHQLESKRADAAAEVERKRADEQRLGEQVETRRSALVHAEAQRAAGLQELRGGGAEQLEEHLRLEAKEALSEAWGAAAVELVGDEGKDLIGALDEARDELTRSRGLLGLFWTPTRIMLATAMALVVSGAVVLLEQEFSPLVSVLGGLTAVVPIVTTVLRTASRWSRKHLGQIETARRAIEADLAARADALEAEVGRAREALNAARSELEAVRGGQSDAQDLVVGIDRDIALLTPASVLAEFVEKRSGSEDYRRHLGLLSRVRDDLRDLEDLVRKNNESPGSASSARDPATNSPPNRIILYIDDLDRCPSNKVVEVLEAVHLLLAFELFVVIVAVDSRWLSFALTDELHALKEEAHGPIEGSHALTQGSHVLSASVAAGTRPTPQDYLEKIFQLPFWVQPLVPEGRRALVHGLIEPSVRLLEAADQPTASPRSELVVGAKEREALDAMLSRRGADPRLEAHALALTSDDLAFMDSLAPLLGDTPRRVKRFVNVVQLLLAMPPELSGTGLPPHERSILMFNAAVSSGLPTVARELFALVKKTPNATLSDAVADLKPGVERGPLSEWLAPAAQQAWQSLSLSGLDVRLDLIRRLSFDRPL